ncbi:putative ubiquitin-protein ligase [Hibiscus syriacus]|uniref:Ubiquitin-protein ligase n=1 Tax=Hibiscus syriacus TaxID=106335 RepID=A0A6A2YDD2_HIBSY|nr:putative ubiquitin-protein ligase [Hibiscus syriacus]
MVYGNGGNPLWQLIYQVGPLSRRFILVISDLLFFGRSNSKSPLRTDLFQAKCLLNWLEKLGVDRFSVYPVSYCGFVAYPMTEMCPDVVERMVIMSSGLLYSDEQRAAHLTNRTASVRNSCAEETRLFEEATTTIGTWGAFGLLESLCGRFEGATRSPSRIENALQYSRDTPEKKIGGAG